MTPTASPEVSAQARLLSLLRLLLLAIGLGTVTLFAAGQGDVAGAVLERARLLLVTVCAAAALLAASVSWVKGRWQLALHLVFDLVWIALLLFWTGGVASPGVVLLFAVVLIGNMVLPGSIPFVLPAVAGMMLSVIAAFYLSERSPFPNEVLAASPDLVLPGRVIGNLVVQIGALFLVDLLGGLLAKRMVESRVFADGVLDQLGEGVLAIDRRGRVAYANAEAARLLGLSETPAAGTELADRISGPDLAEVRKLLASERLPSLERWKGPGGRQLVMRLTELRGRKGQVIGRTLIIADETRLRVLEDSVRRAESLAALGEMAAGIAHEVRNPLTSLRGCAQELGEVAQRSGREDDAKLAQVIVSESDRLARIVGDFLGLSRMRPAHRSEIDIEMVIEEVRTLIASRDDLPPGLVLGVNVADDCPLVSADPDQLRQVLINLANNAIEAMREREAPRLSFRATRAGEDNPLDHDALRLSVLDTGVGIPADQQERVFTPFWSTKAQGTGLGLSVVSRIVREHEGAMRIDSEPGVGTEVIVFLPLVTQTRSFKRALGGR
jgi:nitrogen-specific signal transduction histidine kinase